MSFFRPSRSVSRTSRPLSKGSVSQGLRMLREMGAIKEVSAPAPAATFREATRCGKSRLGALQRALPDLEKSHAETLRSRIKQLQSWHEKARALLPIARTYLKLAPG